MAKKSPAASTRKVAVGPSELVDLRVGILSVLHQESEASTEKFDDQSRKGDGVNDQ